MIKSALSKYPLFLLTIPLVYLAHTLTYYYGLLEWKYITLELSVYISAPIIIYVLLTLFWKPSKKPGILVCFLLLVFYFFYLFYDSLKSIPALQFFARYKILLPLLAFATIALIFFLVKTKRSLSRVYYIVNLALFLLLIAGLIQYTITSFKDPGTINDQGDPGKSLVKNFKSCDTCQKPDIYFIILDSYTNSKTLQSEFNYNNNFIDSILISKNFFLQNNPKSNYNFTHMSIASELNMAYLPNLHPDNIFYTKDFLQSNYTIANNELCDILYKQGYSISNNSYFALKKAPVKIQPYLTELTWRSVLGQTFFNKMNRDIGWNLPRIFSQNHRKARIREIEKYAVRNEQTFNGIIQSAKNPSVKPQFMYAHFLLPHETYIYDSSGSRLPVDYTMSAWMNNKKDYLNQLVYVNKHIINPAIDSIFSYARKPFVIVLQSDHGYRSYPKEKVNLEFENLSAIYFSDNDYSLLKDSLSNVNTFRIVLNKYFKQQLPLLKDSSINLYKKRTIEY